MKVAYSCVVDDSPKLLWEAIVWVAALREICGVAPENLFLHVTDRVGNEARTALRQLSCSVVDIASYHPPHRFSNKLQQIHPATFSSFEYVAFLDADMEVLEPYGLEDVDQATVSGVPVFQPKVPLEVWERLLGAFGLSGFEQVPTVLGGFTYRNYLNGGLYLIPVALLDRLGTRWRGIATEILEGQRNLFGADRCYTDQISFSLAIGTLGMTAKILAREKNLPPVLVPFTPRISAIHGMNKCDALFHHADGTHRWPAQTEKPERYAALDEIMRRTNNHPVAAPFHHYRTMRILDQRGDNEEALGAAVRAAESNLDHDYLNDVAEVLASHGRRAEALAVLNRSLDLAGPARSARLLALRDHLL